MKLLVSVLVWSLSFWVGRIDGTEAVIESLHLPMRLAMLKMSQSNPVLPVRINGEPMNLILTSDIDDLLICADMRSDSLMTSPKAIEFEYARKLLHLQLSGLAAIYDDALVEIPSFNISTQAYIGTFHLKEGWFSATTLEFFLRSSSAVGFIGVGYAYKLRASVFWGMLDTQRHSQYLYNATTFAWSSISNSTNSVYTKAHRVAQIAPLHTDTSMLEWSEPASSVNQFDYNDNEDPINNQGIVLMIHNASFQCVTSLVETIREIDMFGELTGNWDAIVDWNSPCLVLPQEFYDSLAGWTGLVYNDTVKLSQLEANRSILPSISFSLQYKGAIHHIDLSKLVMPSFDNNTARWICILPSESIRQDGKSVFSSMTDERSTLQYRVSGPMRGITLYNMFRSPIIFGHMALAAMGPIVVNGITKQSAWYHRPTDGLETTIVPCQPIVKCIGSQTYIARDNTCQDPNCAAYYFQTLNPETKQCTIQPDWYKFLFTALIALISGELLFSFQTRRLIRQYITTGDVPEGVNLRTESSIGD